MNKELLRVIGISMSNWIFDDGVGISDDDIKECIDTEDYCDVRTGRYDANTIKHHARRVASLIKLIQEGVVLDEIEVYKVYNSDGTFELEIEDGFHRIRAYQYLNKNIPYEIR